MKALLHGLGLAAALLLGPAASQPAAAFPLGLAACPVAVCAGEKGGLVQEAGSRRHWRHHGGWHRHPHWRHGWYGGIGFYGPGYYGYGHPYGVYGYDPYDYGYGYGDGYSIWSEVDPSDNAGDGYAGKADGDYIRDCSQRYRSFNPGTGLYRTYSGRYRRCAYPG